MVIFTEQLLLTCLVLVSLASSERAILHTNTNFKTVCYYPMSDSLNTTAKDPLPPGLNPYLCSHIMFIPTWIDGHNRIIPSTEGHVEIFRRAIPLMRKMNPKLTIMVSNGGKFDPVMESMKNITEFVESALDFMKLYDFDGLDLDWEFPGWAQQHRPHGQVHNFSIVLTELRKAFEIDARKTGKPRFILSTAVCKDKPMADKIYEYDYIKNAVDFVNMMGYDFNGPWLFSTDYNSPLYSEHNESSLTATATFWGTTIGYDKVVIGFPFYCHAFKLGIPSQHGYHSLAVGKGDCDGLGYTCPCLALKNKNATSVWDDVAKVPYVYYGDQWVSYENEKSVTLKAKWIIENKFAGLMVWHMHSDDYNAECDGKTKYPLMKSVLKVINGNRG